MGTEIDLAPRFSQSPQLALKRDDRIESLRTCHRLQAFSLRDFCILLRRCALVWMEHAKESPTSDSDCYSRPKRTVGGPR